MFDMLHVLLNMMEICTKLHFYPISSHIFDRRVLRHVRSRYVMFHYTPATKYNRMDMYCVVPIGTGATYRKNCFFPIFFPKEIPEFRRREFWEKSCRNLTDIGTEIWKISYSNPALLLATLLTRDWYNIQRCLVQKPYFFWCPWDKLDFGHELRCPLTMCKNIVHNVNVAYESFGACICYTIWHKHILYWKSKFAQRWNPYLIHEGNPYLLHKGFINLNPVLLHEGWDPDFLRRTRRVLETAWGGLTLWWPSSLSPS